MKHEEGSTKKGSERVKPTDNAIKEMVDEKKKVKVKVRGVEERKGREKRPQRKFQITITKTRFPEADEPSSHPPVLEARAQDSNSKTVLPNQ